MYNIYLQLHITYYNKDIYLWYDLAIWTPFSTVRKLTEVDN